MEILISHGSTRTENFKKYLYINLVKKPKFILCLLQNQSKNIEEFQSVHHVSFILCYTVLYDLLVSAAASVGTEQMSTGHLVPLLFPLPESVNTGGMI